MNSGSPYKNHPPLKLLLNNQKLQIFPSFKTSNVDSIIAFVFGVKEDNIQVVTAVVNGKFLPKTRWKKIRLRNKDVVEIIGDKGMLEIPEKFLKFKIDSLD